MPTDLEQVSKSVEYVYAAALLDLAAAGGNVDGIRQEADELAAMICEEPGLGDLLSSRVLAKAERSGSIERIFKGRIDDLLYRFIQVVNSKDRLDMLGVILKAFGQLVDRRNGIMEVDAYVAAELDADTVQRVSAELSEIFSGNVILRQHVDPDLLGGLKLRIGDQLIDASVATQLRKMKQQLINAGREKTRNNIDQYLTQ